MARAGENQPSTRLNNAHGLSHDSDMPFHFNAKKLALTYSQTAERDMRLSKEILLERAKSEIQGIQGFA